MRQRGHSMMELVLVIAILGAIAIAIAPGIMIGVESFAVIGTRSESLSQARAGMDRIISEIRVIPSTDEINSIGANSFNFEYPAGTSITYSISGGKILRNSDDLIDNATALNFAYYDEIGNTTAVSADVRSIEVSLAVDPPGDAATHSIRSRVFLRNASNTFGNGFDMD